MNIEKDDIKYLINHQSMYDPKETIRISILGLLLICVPTAVFGAFSNITSVVMIPIAIAFFLWSITLSRKSIDQNQLNLYDGIYAIFISLTCLLAAYKQFSSIDYEVPLKITFLILELYFVCIAVNIIITIYLIKKGYYRQQKKHMNMKPLVAIVMFIGIVSGRKILGGIDRNILDNAIGIGIVVFAFLSALGTVGILKYYLAIKVKD